MRLFGKVTHFLHISRCLSYHAPICRPHRLLHGSCKQWKKICSSCVCWQPPQLVEMLPSVPTMIHVHLYSQRAGVFNPSCNVDMLRKRISFSGAPSDSIEASPANVVPVGIIMPEATDGKQLKIVIVPMDLANTDVESLRSTLEALNQLRKHAHEIEAFTNSMMEDLRKESKREIKAADEEQTTEKTKLNFFEGYIQGIDAVASPTNNISTAQVELAETATLSKVAIDADVAPKPPSVPYTPNIPVTPSQTPLSPNTAPGTMPPSLPSSTPLGDPKETQICADVDVEPEIDATASAEHNLDEAIVSNEPKVDQISIEVPDSLGQRLNDMAISSMHLSFEMDMTNVRDAILNGNDNSRANITLGDDALVFLETKVEADPENTPAHTVPLRFNALIKGTVQIDTGKLNPEHLSDELLPEYNDTVTSIAASICSTALQRGFGPEMQESFVDAVATTSPVAAAESNAPVASSKMSAQARMAMRRNHAQKRIKQEHSRPTMATHAMPEIEEVPSETPLLKDGCKYPVIKPKKKCPKKCPLLDDPCKESPCKRPKDPKKSNVKKAEKTVQITASSKKGGKGNKKDPCAKDGGKGDKKKKDPCAKKDGKDGKGDKKKDPCAKFKKGGKDGKKKDPCAKKDGKDGKGDKKKDPCAKFKKGGKDGKKKDPCAKKDGKDGKGDKKKDPCAKFKKGDKDGKKKDPCAKKDDKKDPCAKKDGKDGKGDKKKDPCAKFKKGGKDGKKKDPCAKKDKKKDPCAKKDGKGDKKKKDPCAKKNGKGDKKKKDPCAKFKKDDKKDPCKKKFSTSASPVSKFYNSNAYRFNKSHNPKRFMSTAQKQISETSATSPTNSYLTSAARFATYSTLMRRRYGGMPSVSQLNAWNIKSQDVRDQIERCYSKKSSPKKSKNVKKAKKDKKEKKLKSKDSSKCQAIAPKAGPKDRKHIKARTALRTDCYGKGSEEDCPKSFCGAKCGTVPFPRKKCARDNPKPKKLETFKKPEKKLPPICYKMKGGPKSKKQPKPKGKEINELLVPSSFTRQQKRMHCDYANLRKRYISQAKKALVNDYYPKEDEYPNTMMETVRIPESYQICKERVMQPDLKPFDVLIGTGSIALTGSDIHVYENANRDLEGMTLGHDATGYVEKVGSGVQHLHVGDRVVMESALSCGICHFCKRGMYNICADLIYNGFLATHQSHPADLCHRLPDSISMEEGALTQTLAMGCQACFKAQVSPTSTVLIVGTSPTAVAAAQCATAIGAKKVIIAGTMIPSLEMIQNDFGLNTIHFNTNDLFGEVLEAVYSKFEEWPNCAINCAITPMTMNLAVMALQPCSVCVLAECESECASFNALDVLMKNIRLIPSFRSANMYPTALQLMKSGRAKMHKLIARTFSWSMLEDAFKCAQHESNVGLRKIIVNNTEEINIGGLFKKKNNQF